MDGAVDRVRFRPVRPVRAYQRIVEQVEAAMFAGDLRPGARLPSERELMGQFGVSRATVREALRVLESGGLIQSRPGDPAGPLVVDAAGEALHTSMSRLARLDGVGLGDLLGFRMILDSSANMLAARLGTAADFAEMAAAIGRMRDAVEIGYDRFSEEDVCFHEAVARASHNKLIQVCGQVVRAVVLDLIADKIAHAPDARAVMLQTLGHHADVLDAVRAGDGDRATELSRTTLFAYYGGYLTSAERATVAPLLPGDGGDPGEQG